MNLNAKISLQSGECQDKFTATVSQLCLQSLISIYSVHKNIYDNTFTNVFWVLTPFTLSQVLYHMFEGFSHLGQDNLIMQDYLSAIASFLLVALGGTAIGIIWGFLTAFVTRYIYILLFHWDWRNVFVGYHIIVWPIICITNIAK